MNTPLIPEIRKDKSIKRLKPTKFIKQIWAHPKLKEAWYEIKIIKIVDNFTFTCLLGP